MIAEDFDTAAIAHVVHETNRAYALTLGDTSIPAWEHFPSDGKISLLEGVKQHLEASLTGEAPTPEQSHTAWMGEKLAQGWKYGEVKDWTAKTNPCLLPYADLPVEQRMKDFLFIGTHSGV